MELNKNEDINKINLDGIQVESSSKEEAIRVCTRIRPLFEKEINQGHLKAWKMNETDMHLIIDPPSMTEMLNARVAKKGNKIELKKNVEKSEGQKAVIQRHYAFDRCFDDFVGNDEVYKHLARDIILDTFKGINGCILAYGQTGSGKTHSVMGIPDDPGMLPRSLAEFFNGIENPSSLNENNISIGDDDGHSNESNNNNDNNNNNNNTKEFLMSVTYLEVYMERVNDLLQEGYRGGAMENLDVKEDPKRGFVVIGIQEETVTSIDEVMLLVAKAEQRRHIAQTNFNETSSRSHTIFTVILESNQVLNDGTSINKKGELKIVDLAGNERAGRAAEGIENSKTLMEEGKAINKSLFVLSEVISKLSKRAQTITTGDEKKIKRFQEDLVFIPWRDSKLTRILSKSLGGNCRASVIVAVHPSHFYLDTSFSTLRFALKCKTIKKKIEVNYLSAEQSVIMQQKELIAKLQNQLKHLATTKNVDMQLSGGGDNKYSTNRKPEDDEKILALKHELEEKVKKFQNFILKSEFHVNSSNYRTLHSIDEHTEKSLKYSMSISNNMKNEYNWLRSLDTNEYDTKWDGFDKYDDQNAKEKFNISKAMDYLKNKSPYKLNSSEMSDILSTGSQKDDSISLNYYNELDELEKLEKNELMKREKKRKENNKEKDRDRDRDKDKEKEKEKEKEKMDTRSVVSNKVYDDISKLNIIESNNFNENKDKFHLKRKETKKKQKMQKRINNMMDYMTKGTLLFKKSKKLKNKNKKKKLKNNNINYDNINGDNINDDNINDDNINDDNINDDNINDVYINNDDNNNNNMDHNTFNTKKMRKKNKKKRGQLNKIQQICKDKNLYETSSIIQNEIEEDRVKNMLKEKGESAFQSFDNNINDTNNGLIKSISSSVKFVSSKERYNNNQKRKSIISNLKEKIEEDLKKKKKIINRNVELNKQIKFIMKLMQKLGLSPILTGTVPPGRNIENVLKLQENLKDDLRLTEYNKKSTNILGVNKSIYNENNNGNEIDEGYETKNDNVENTLLNSTLDENENDNEYNETISHVFINEMFFSFVLKIQQKYNNNKGNSLNDIEEILKNEENPYDISKKALEEILGCSIANKVNDIEEKNCMSKQIKDEKNKKTIDSILNMLTPWEQKILALLYEQQKMRQNVQKIKEKFSQRIQNINIFIKKILIDKIEVEKHLNRVLKATENYKEDLLKTSDVDSNFKFAGLMKKLEELSISLAEKNRDFNVLAEFHLNLRKTLEHKDNLIKELQEENKLFYLVPRYNELLQQLDENEEIVTIEDEKGVNISHEEIVNRVPMSDNNNNKCDGNIYGDNNNKCDDNIYGDNNNKCDGNIYDGPITKNTSVKIATKELKKEFLLMYGRLMFSRKKLQEKEVIEHDMRNLNKKIYTELVESISVIKNLESQNKFLEFKLNMENKKKLEKIKKVVKEKEKLNKFIHEIEKRLQNENIDFEDLKKEILLNNNMSENNLESQDDENEKKDFIEKLENEANNKNKKKGKKNINKIKKMNIKKKKEENEGSKKNKNYMKEKRVNKNGNNQNGNNQNDDDHNDEEKIDEEKVNKNGDIENNKIYYDQNNNFVKEQNYKHKEYKNNNDYKFNKVLKNNVLNPKIHSNLKKKNKIKIKKKNISEEKIKLNTLYDDNHSGLSVGKTNKFGIDEKKKKKKIITNKIGTKNIQPLDGYLGKHIMSDKYLSSNSIINQKLMKTKRRIKNKKYIQSFEVETKSFLDSIRSRNSVMKKKNNNNENKKKEKKKKKIPDKGKTKSSVEKNEPFEENQHKGNNNEEEKEKEKWEEQKYNSSSTDFENNEVRQMLDVEIEKKKSNQILH
ncbi:kinesin-7, putative [Plasmodium sp. gorilla clade G2]|uniref:kinesin-7, putative n=1 Tax=Plasmodium sp. gorilla clade G2 TaxID=880535 RepID=UPI000D225903|nr:kinesin-7, putative [Plasmodium sp. gorilla clade G2]SOV16646.1 kinesin-7, putative [Plasmodium sp. gorilla clade G2]